LAGPLALLMLFALLMLLASPASAEPAAEAALERELAALEAPVARQDWAAALVVVERAKRLASRTHGQQSEAYFDLQFKHAELLGLLNDLPGATAAMEEAITIAATLPKTTPPRIGMLLHRLAQYHHAHEDHSARGGLSAGDPTARGRPRLRGASAVPLPTAQWRARHVGDLA